MAAHAHTRSPRTWDLRARLKAFADRLELDRQLAAGAAPDESAALARRAHVLRGRRVRHALANGLPRAVVEAITPPRAHVRAIATASVLLSDGGAPLFNPHTSMLLGEVAFQAAFHAEAD